MWGRQFARLAFPYFSPRGRQGWGPLVTLLLLLLLTIAGVRLTVLFSYVNNDLFTALQQLDPRSVPALDLDLRGPGGDLGGQQPPRVLRPATPGDPAVGSWLNDRIVGDWLDGGAYHRNRFITRTGGQPGPAHPGGHRQLPDNSATLAIGAVSRLVSLVSFTIVLWQLSGPLSVFGVEIPRAMTFVAYLYVIIATVIAFRIGRPLIRLNFLRERFHASFRYALVRLRDNSENVAFHRGEPVERATLSTRFPASSATPGRSSSGT